MLKFPKRIKDAILADSPQLIKIAFYSSLPSSLDTILVEDSSISSVFAAFGYTTRDKYEDYYVVHDLGAKGVDFKSGTGAQYIFTEEDLWEGGFTCTRTSCEGSAITWGTAISADVNIKLKADSRPNLSYRQINKSYVVVLIGASMPEDDSDPAFADVSELVNKYALFGVFKVDEAKYTKADNTISVDCSDFLSVLDVKITADLRTKMMDEINPVSSESNYYPVRGILNWIEDNYWPSGYISRVHDDIINSKYSIPSMSTNSSGDFNKEPFGDYGSPSNSTSSVGLAFPLEKLVKGTTIRKLLTYIAALCGAFVYVDEYGQLRMTGYATQSTYNMHVTIGKSVDEYDELHKRLSPQPITPANRYTANISDRAYKLVGYRYTTLPTDTQKSKTTNVSIYEDYTGWPESPKDENWYFKNPTELSGIGIKSSFMNLNDLRCFQFEGDMLYPFFSIPWRTGSGTSAKETPVDFHYYRQWNYAYKESNKQYTFQPIPLVYRPFEAECLSMPWLMPGDAVLITEQPMDESSNIYVRSVVTTITYDFNGTTKLSCCQGNMDQASSTSYETSPTAIIQDTANKVDKIEEILDRIAKLEEDESGDLNWNIVSFSTDVREYKNCIVIGYGTHNLDISEGPYTLDNCTLIGGTFKTDAITGSATKPMFALKTRVTVIGARFEANSRDKYPAIFEENRSKIANGTVTIPDYVTLEGTSSNINAFWIGEYNNITIQDCYFNNVIPARINGAKGLRIVNNRIQNAPMVVWASNANLHFGGNHVTIPSDCPTYFYHVYYLSNETVCHAFNNDVTMNSGTNHYLWSIYHLMTAGDTSTTQELYDTGSIYRGSFNHISDSRYSRMFMNGCDYRNCMNTMSSNGQHLNIEFDCCNFTKINGVERESGTDRTGQKHRFVNCEIVAPNELPAYCEYKNCYIKSTGAHDMLFYNNTDFHNSRFLISGTLKRLFVISSANVSAQIVGNLFEFKTKNSDGGGLIRCNNFTGCATFNTVTGANTTSNAIVQATTSAENVNYNSINGVAVN